MSSVHIVLLSSSLFFFQCWVGICQAQQQQLESDGQQEEAAVFPASCSMNVLIVLDRSDSVRGSFNRSREFVLNISEELNVGPKAHSVALIAYSGPAYRPEIHSWNFAKDNAEFRQKVQNLRVVGGTTDTRLALERALTMMEGRNQTIPTVVLVVTDGLSFTDPSAPAERLRQIPNTRVVAAATGNRQLVNRKELLQIAGREEQIIMQSAYETAEQMTRRLLREAQERCRPTTTTTTTTESPFTGCEQDLVLVLDFSTSTWPVYRDYIRLAEQLVSHLRIGPRFTRVGLVLFSSEQKTDVVFPLDAYSNAKQVIDAIQDLHFHYAGGTTAIGAGLRAAAALADPAKGARPGLAKQLMVVFTDGWNNVGPDPEEGARMAEQAGFRILAVTVESHGKVPAAVEEQQPKSEQHQMLPVRQQTMHSIVRDPGDAFADRDFDRLVQLARQRNAPCMDARAMGKQKKGESGPFGPLAQ